MISQLTWKETVEIFGRYLEKEYPNKTRNAEEELLKFLGWDEPKKDDFGAETQILLVSADFSDELITSVLWLRDFKLNIRCVQISPYKFRQETLVNVRHVIPMPEAKDYQIRVRRKDEERKLAKQSGRDSTKYIFRCIEYNKRQLVLAVIHAWFDDNKPQNIDELTKAFPQKITYGPTFVLRSEVKDESRHFIKEKEQIKFDNGERWVISNQWGGDGHKDFVEITRGLGYDIEEVA